MSQKPLEKRRQMLNKLSDHRRWYDIKNKAGEVAEVRIYDEISIFGVTAEDFVGELDDISAPEMVVAINCPGGDVFDGIAIYNALRAHPAKVTTRVDSIAASAASVIVQAGDHRIMLSAAQQMIHDAWGFAMGNAEDMAEMADLLNRQSEVIVGIYAERTGKEKAHFRGLMKAETWFTDEESIAEGLADEVVNPSKAEKTAARATRTLNDEIKETVDAVSATLESAEKVAAIRAEKDKPLSEGNKSSLDELDGLLERTKALLERDQGVDAPVTDPPPDDEIESLKALIDAAAL